MSNVKIEGNASGTGTLTIQAPNTNTDRTFSLPDVTGDIVTTGDTGTIIAGMLDGGQSGSAPIFGVRAWCSFNGTGTISIYQSGNVSSLTDHGTGNYSINFTTNMPNASYCAIHTHNQELLYSCSQQQATVAVDRYQMYVREHQNSFVDASFVAAMCIA